MGIPIGLQLYTTGDETRRDFLGTIRRVAAIGYDGVEFAGYFDTPAPTLKATLEDCGLRAAGTHLPVPVLRGDLAAQIEYSLAIGCPTILCPAFRVEERSAAFFERMADFFNDTASMCRASGLDFAYHIHGHEFVDFDGRSGMDILFERTDPALVGFELDTYWVEKAGVDALTLFQANAGRCTFIHFKDAIDRVDWHDTEIGAGIIDVPGILAAAGESAVGWFIVEQEAFTMPPMDSVAVSLANLRRLYQQSGKDQQ
ncbi:MAG: sugar phosphate isomerase/epimerase [Anaerolineaceae bacterium]|nr:sugar phosphate isomerase/epimerase [Anaerolineaceae bacterium]